MTQTICSPCVHALIVAAGKGTRFGTSQAKQYQVVDLNDFGIDIRQTVLQWSVAALARHASIERCTLVLAADDEFAKTLDFDLACDFVIGGQTRFDSVKAGLQHISSYAKPTDYVLIHDAARPCLSLRDLNAVIDDAICYPDMAGAILAHPVADTLKATKTIQPAHISHSVNREHLWQALTPQVFQIERLLSAIQALPAKAEHITDEASVFELTQSQAVLLTQGSRTNIKLTYQDDLPMIQAILAQMILAQHPLKTPLENH